MTRAVGVAGPLQQPYGLMNLQSDHAMGGVTGPVAVYASGDPAGRSFVSLKAHRGRFETLAAR